MQNWPPNLIRLFWAGVATAILEAILYLIFDLRDIRASKDRKLAQFFERLSARLAHLLRFVLDRALGGTQKILISRIGGTASTMLIAIWLALEKFGPERLGPLVAGASPAITAAAAASAYAHAVKLWLDEYAKKQYKAIAGSKDLLSVQLSNLTDFFLQPDSEALSFRSAMLADKVRFMLAPMARHDKDLRVVFYRLKTDLKTGRVEHTRMAVDQLAQENFYDEYVNRLADELSSVPLSERTHLSYCLVKELPRKLDQARFREGCIVIEDLGAERYLGYMGRNFFSLDEGSCVAYTLGLPDGSVGYLLLAFCKARGGFRARDHDNYSVPLRAAGMLMLGLDPVVPRSLPPSRRTIPKDHGTKKGSQK